MDFLKNLQILNKVACQRLETLLTKETPLQMLSCNFYTIGSSKFVGQLQRQPSEVLSYGCSVKKDVLNNFANITGKLCQLGLHLNYKDTATHVFSFKICEIFQMTYLEEHLQTTASGTTKGVFPNISAAKFMLKVALKIQCSWFVQT